ncbi:EpsG family protein [Peribacillus frigoritolerans]|uniref:EpsG family protein n=1 Tax=Peribacillus frigoritolerans TaxID=450367 RepID=UPI0020BFD8C6|nr:EpsG family protein [Peribacillus frigoritolerans]
MGIYFITILLAYTSAWIAQKVYVNRLNKQEVSINKFFVFLTASILVFVAGTRWGVGTDYWQYALNYNKYIETVGIAILNFDEPGIYLLAKISSLIYDDYTSMFFVSSAITISLIIRTISKYSNMFALSILLFIFMGFWHGSFNGIRQYLACAILFAGHRYIIDRKLIKYIFVVFAASAFHTTALVMFFLYFVPIKKIGIKQIILISIGSIALLYSYNFVFSFIEALRGRPVSSILYITNDVTVFRVAVMFAPILVYFFLTSKNKLDNNDMFYINLLFINAALMLGTSGSAYLARLSIYTNIFATLAFPRLLYIQDKYLEFIIRSLIIFLYAIFWYIDVSGSNTLSNFQWIFNR